jgi:hypothetical protein
LVLEGGKYRQVEWRQIYKDGSFNKNVAEGEGKRVRTSERMRERQGRSEVWWGIERKTTEVGTSRKGEIRRRVRRRDKT